MKWTGLFKEIAKDYGDNHKHYHDAAAFNFCNGFEKHKEYKNLIFYDLPPAVRKFITDVYLQLQKKNTAELYSLLGLKSNVGNNNSPLETKYVYAYFKKYNTLRYKKENKVSLEELLKPLTGTEQYEYNNMF